MELALAFVAAALLVCLAACRAARSAGGPARYAERLPDGTQRVTIVVQGGYRPSRVDLDAGVPATLRFDRRDDDPCGELLVSELWPTVHRLAPGETEIRFTPQRPGHFPFTCGMGMYSGVLVVHEAAS
ncbi:MAG TPA: cupredoxin domain-containing protein [Candidatus Limnocylindria bacterium]|nr:cupredoxin domain-containing protein [Candidatus Limnocylindria bacterium]